MTSQAFSPHAQGNAEVSKPAIASQASEIDFNLEDLIPGISAAIKASNTAVSTESGGTALQSDHTEGASGKLLFCLPQSFDFKEEFRRVASLCHA